MIVSDIVNIMIQSIAFILGLFINIRIIYACLNDKSSKTRSIHIIYSIFSTIFYLFDIPFAAITNEVPNLSMYTGEWLCHISSFIIIFCIHIIFMNSFWVALMKYVFIVHWDRALQWGHEKIERVLLIISLVLPLIFTIIIILTKDFDSYETLNSCYGIETKKMDPLDGMKGYFLCDLTNLNKKDIHDYILYVIIQATCISRSILTLPATTNLSEALFYYTIFKRMKRQVEPAPDNMVTATSTLPEVVQQHNVKKVVVNAKVTFGIWILETVALAIVTLLFVILRLNRITTTLVMILFYVLLPYIFLVNTSDNKQVWIDNGFAKMIRKVTSMGTNGKSTQEHDDIMEKGVINVMRNKKQTSHHLSSSAGESPNTSDTSFGERRQASDEQMLWSNAWKNVYTISNNEMDIPYEQDLPLVMSDGKCLASTSFGMISNQTEAIRRHLIYNSSRSETDTPILQGKSHLQLAKDILNLMNANIKVEERYMYYFHELLRLDEETLNGNLDDFDVIVFDERPLAKQCVVKGCNKSESSSTTSSISSDRSKNIPPPICEGNKKYYGKLQDRIHLRQTHFRNYNGSYNNKNEYASFCNTLIKMEERLVVEIDRL